MDDNVSFLNTFLAAISAISSVSQVMIAQEQRLKPYKFPELFSRTKRTDLPPDYIRLVSSLNEEALDAGLMAFAKVQHENKIDTANLERRIPKEVRQAMTANVERCWQRLTEFISDNNYTPEERSRAHKFARKCVCQELQHMVDYLGNLPEELQGYWNACQCPNPLNA